MYSSSRRAEAAPPVQGNARSRTMAFGEESGPGISLHREVPAERVYATAPPDATFPQERGADA